MRVLGFDVSSATIGWGTLDVSLGTIEVVASGVYKPIKSSKAGMAERLWDVKEWTRKMCNDQKADTVVIEDIMTHMKDGPSSAKTMSTLAVFNRSVMIGSFESISEEPHLYLPITIRSTIRKHIGRKDQIKKEDVPQVIFSNLDYDYPLELKKTGTLREENFDRADGIAAAWCHCIKLLEPGSD